MRLIRESHIGDQLRRYEGVHHPLYQARYQPERLALYRGGDQLSIHLEWLVLFLLFPDPPEYCDTSLLRPALKSELLNLYYPRICRKEMYTD